MDINEIIQVRNCLNSIIIIISIIYLIRRGISLFSKYVFERFLKQAYDHQFVFFRCGSKYGHCEN